MRHQTVTSAFAFYLTAFAGALARAILPVASLRATRGGAADTATRAACPLMVITAAWLVLTARLVDVSSTAFTGGPHKTARGVSAAEEWRGTEDTGTALQARAARTAIKAAAGE